MNKFLISLISSFVFGAPLAHAAPFSDSFSGSSLNPGWAVVNPNGASSVALTGTGALRIIASPANGGSDLFPGSNFNAPRILQKIDPTLNWTIETKINFNPTNNYQAAGIMLATTDGFFSNGNQFMRLEEWAFYPRGGGNIIEAGGNYPYSGNQVYFRAEKEGSKYTDWFSRDGQHWILGGAGFSSTLFPEIGLFAIRQGWDGAPVQSVADFDYFKVTVSGVPEPASVALLGVGLLGLAFLLRRPRKVVDSL